MDDTALLARYAKTRSDDAWSELVRRHGAMVYAAALRQVGGDSHLAEEVTQVVFILLARGAGKIRIRGGRSVSGWMYEAARLSAKNAMRAARRRAKHERRAAALRPRESAMQEQDDPWSDIAPLLDPALAALPESDRELILLRFFENQSLAEASAALGIRPNTASKRLQRAIERLRQEFAARGVTISAAVLMADLAKHAIPPLPVSIDTLCATQLAPSQTLVGLADQTRRLLMWSKVKFAASIAAPAAAAGCVMAIGMARALSAPSSQPAPSPPQATTAPVAVSRPAAAGPATLPDASNPSRRIQPGDIITVTIADLMAVNVDTVRRLRILPDGTINLPFIANLNAKGRTCMELLLDIGEQYRKQGLLNNANVTVEFVQPTSRPAQ